MSPKHRVRGERSWTWESGLALSPFIPSFSHSQLWLWSAYLLIEQAEHQVEEEALQAVEQGEDVGQPCAVGVEEKQAEDPGTAQHSELGNGCDGQHPVGWVDAANSLSPALPTPLPAQALARPPQPCSACLPHCPSHRAFLNCFMFGLISENFIVSFQTVTTKMAELH